MNNKRYVASILLEADTPLCISSGDKDLYTDSAIMKDANGLPMILGTSITGVLRHGLFKNDQDKENSLFGYQDKKKEDGQGSQLIVSNAHFVGKDGIVIEGLKTIDWKDKFYKKMRRLPIRQHTKISDRGSTDSTKRGKFDEQLVFKGTRFCFEMELTGNKNDELCWKQILHYISKTEFRIGGGTRKGLGGLKIVKIKQKCFDLKTELNQYLMKTASLNNHKYLDDFTEIDDHKESDWLEYILHIKPDHLWLFGSGLSDYDADITPVYEEMITWIDQKASFTDRKLLIPASSVKGAISHRVAFNYNKICNKFVDTLTDNEIDNCIGEKNLAVKTLFGSAKSKDQGMRGNVIFSDFFPKSKEKPKILNHVAIDRFTGGTIDGALFDEKVINGSEEIQFKFFVHKEAIKDKNIKDALEKTLNDICNGMLPLGGGTMRGHGCFNGRLEKCNE